jgi:K+-transporting ATPase ATPase C chain
LHSGDCIESVARPYIPIPVIPDETEPNVDVAPPDAERPRRSLAVAVRLTIVLAVLCGVVYPALIYVGAQFAFRASAEGSVLHDRCRVAVGSSLVGQSFSRPGYFWGRPSAVGYDASISGGSNFGPLNAALRDSLNVRAAAFRSANSLGKDDPVPADAITASGSGIDPHVSPPTALLQIQRVVRARSSGRDTTLLARKLRAFVAAHTAGPQFGILGDPRVNVLELNLALDSLDDDLNARPPACATPTAPGRSP